MLCFKRSDNQETNLIELSGGKVGIGTTTPTTVLDVVGGITISSTGWADGARANSLVLDNNNGDSRLFAVGADATTDGSFAFWTAQTDGGANSRMTITSAGNVGIGTTTPQGLLHIKHATNSTQLSANHIFGLSTGGISISAVPIAKAWCVFEAKDEHEIIGGQSYNVSSITNPSGTINQVNFATDMPSADYAVVAQVTRTGTNNGDIGVEYLTQTASSVRFQAGNSGGAFSSTEHEISVVVYAL